VLEADVLPVLWVWRGILNRFVGVRVFADSDFLQRKIKFDTGRPQKSIAE
jgi:hypothetical protein